MSKTNLELAQELITQAGDHWYSDRFAQAEPFRRQALALQEQEFGPDSPDVLDTLDGLAWILHEQGKYTEVGPLFRRSLQLRKSEPQFTKSDVVDGIYQVAVSCHVQHKFGGAKVLYEQALELHGASAREVRHIKELYKKLLGDMKKRAFPNSFRFFFLKFLALFLNLLLLLDIMRSAEFFWRFVSISAMNPFFAMPTTTPCASRALTFGVSAYQIGSGAAHWLKNDDSRLERRIRTCGQYGFRHRGQRSFFHQQRRPRPTQPNPTRPASK